MTIHFMHIGKTGGTAIKNALRGAGLAYTYDHKRDSAPETPYGRIKLHGHWVRVSELPPEDWVVFFVRDPVDRFLSGFYSRLKQGQPRYFYEWTPEERTAFEAFPTPQRLVLALVSTDTAERELAEWAMGRIRHLTRMRRWIGSPARLREQLPRIAYIGRQETLDRDWRQLKEMLELPADLELPRDPVAAYVGDYGDEPPLDRSELRVLRDWYAPDYELLRLCDRVREERGWAPRPPRRERLRGAVQGAARIARR